MSKIRLLDNEIKCNICEKMFNNLIGLSQHLKLHNINSLEYTKKYILLYNIPKCKCGCNEDVNVFPFSYGEYKQNHNQKFWQKTLDKDSDEYKNIINKISNTVKQYAKENPKVVSDETRLKLSNATKQVMSNDVEKQRRIAKMTATKRKQSESGHLSEHHWTKVNNIEWVNDKLTESGNKSSKTKLERFVNGQLHAWNKGLTKENDARVLNASNDNNYRYTGKDINDERKLYTRKFRNKEYRNYILEQQNFLCFYCNIESNKSLCLHHLDEDKTNDSFENLIFLCRSCHMKIHNNKCINDILYNKTKLFKIELITQNKTNTKWHT
jgi:hypothetical protein